MSLNYFDIPQMHFTPLVPVEDYFLAIQWVSRLPNGVTTIFSKIYEIDVIDLQSIHQHDLNNLSSIFELLGQNVP